MKTFIVPVKTISTELFEVKAGSAEEAMYLALEDCDEDYCKSIEIIDGDAEVYYPDIHEKVEI